MKPARATVTLVPWNVIAALALLVLLFFAGRSAAGPLAEVDLYDRELGQALEVHRAGGRSYVVGEPGHEYAIRIRNRSHERVLAVVSVDGVNVVTGETAAPDQSGYVIEPGDYVNILGWRKDLGRTAAFYFTDLADSYAARTGRPDNLGVVGVALFRERTRPVQLQSPFPAASEAAPGAAPSAGRNAERAFEDSKSDARLGTGHGRGEYSPARRVEFERRSGWPDQKVVYHYDRESRLLALGVLPSRRPYHRDSDPFPATLGFVPDP